MDGLECIFKAFDRFPGGAFKSAAPFVVRDEIDFCLGIAGDLGKAARLFGGIVDPGEKDILKGEQSARGFPVLAAGGKNVLNIPAVGIGDQQSTGLVIGPVEGNCQIPLLAVFREGTDPGSPAAGGNGDAALGNTDAIRITDRIKRLFQIVVVEQRLTHTHHHDVVRTFPGETAEQEKFFNDLTRLQIADQSVSAADTEGAADRAADLGAEAERDASIFRRDRGTFNAFAVIEFDQILSGSVRSGRLLQERGAVADKMFFQGGLDRSGKVCHAVRIADPFFRDPAVNLVGAELTFTNGKDKLLQVSLGCGCKERFAFKFRCHNRLHSCSAVLHR